MLVGLPDDETEIDGTGFQIEERRGAELPEYLVLQFLPVFFLGRIIGNNPIRQQKGCVQLLLPFHDLGPGELPKERSIAFYADMLCLTPKYLSQVIYKCSGSFASEWIRKMVILEAKSLLDNKNFSVQQISDMMNFPNPSFFGKYFKAATGMTPRKYRMQ